MRNVISKTAARTFKWVREQYGMTIKQFSQATGISTGMLSMIEKCKRRPGGETILKLQEFTGKPICLLQDEARWDLDAHLYEGLKPAK